MRKLIFSSFPLGALLLFAVDTSLADDVTPASDSIAEIIVTAQKRAESVQQVPISVTVVSAEELQRQGIQTIQDLSRTSASLEFISTSSGAPGGGAFIRGIGTETVGGYTATGSVSVVLDGVVMGNVNLSNIFDLNRVEVLKGPQGTLFGSSVSAGVINVVTNAPDPAAKFANISAEYGSNDLGSDFSRRIVRAAVNLPVSDASALRIAMQGYGNSDISPDTYTGTESQETGFSARARYLLYATDNLVINLIADIDDVHAENPPTLTYRYAPPDSALANSLAQCGVSASVNNVANCSDKTRYQNNLNRGISAQIDWTIGDNTLTAISSYRLANMDVLSDVPTIPTDIMRANFGTCNFVSCLPLIGLTTGTPQQPQSDRQHLYTEEMRLTSPTNAQVQWVAGVYYQKYRETHIQPADLELNLAGGNPTGDVTVPSLLDVGVSTQDYAVFGNVTYNLTTATRLIGGARYTDSTVREAEINTAYTGNNVNELSTSAREPTWRLGVQQDLTAYSMAYFTISTGYKAPEISDDVSGGKKMYPVRPELPTSYELGIKQGFFDNRLAVNADVFYEDVKDYQGESCLPNPTEGIVCSAINIARVETKGLEMDVFGRPIVGMRLNFSGILDPATYPGGYVGSDGSSLGGKQLNFAPKVKLTFSAEQAVPVSDRYSLVVGADATYRSQESMYLSGDPQYTVNAATIFNARVGLKSTSNWAVYVFGRNLGDKVYPTELYPTSAFQSGGLWQLIDSNSRRLVGLQLEATF